MKINEFLAEINMLPEAVHLLNELQESGRIGEEEYQENKLLYENCLLYTSPSPRDCS